MKVWLQKGMQSTVCVRVALQCIVYVTVVGSVPESRARTRDIKDDNYVNMYT